jgi:hypothetical protein
MLLKRIKSTFDQYYYIKILHEINKTIQIGFYSQNIIFSDSIQAKYLFIISLLLCVGLNT